MKEMSEAWPDTFVEGYLHQFQPESTHKIQGTLRAFNCEYETETTTWSEFPNGGEGIVEQRLVSEERNKSRRAGL